MNKIHYNPVSEAYRLLVKVLHQETDSTKEDYEIAIEQAIGFLGEALEDLYAYSAI